MRGEIHLTADVLWLAEIDGEEPRESAPAGNWCLRHRCGSDENQYRYAVQWLCGATFPL